MKRPNHLDARVDSEIYEAVKKRSEEIARSTGSEPNLSAAHRDLLRIGISQLEKAKAAGWDSGYREGCIEGSRNVKIILKKIGEALSVDVDPIKIVEVIDRLVGRKKIE